jgi:hypothetical protein
VNYLTEIKVELLEKYIPDPKILDLINEVCGNNTSKKDVQNGETSNKTAYYCTK